MRSLALALVLVLSSWPVLAANITAKSWIVADGQGNIIAKLDADTVRPIASISKLLTVMIVLDAGQDLAETLKLSDKIADTLPGNETYTRRNLIDLALVRSDNRAAQTLCERYVGGYEACVAAMNAKAKALAMDHTVMRDPTGLDVRNVSTARDLVKLVLAAEQYDIIKAAAKKPNITVYAHQESVTFTNTDPLVGKMDGLLVSKTGYTNASGGCIVLGTAVRIAILLASVNTHTRILEVKSLMESEF